MILLEAHKLQKNYQTGNQVVEALKQVSISVHRGDSIAIMGPSGSGKSTLLQILGGMLKPDSGSLVIAGKSIETFNDDQLSKLRRRKLGFVFQKFNLLHTLTTLENIAWPLLIDGKPRSISLERAKEMLEKVGLLQRQAHFPNQLSGGEQQRVALARALVAKPEIVFADEPTGALDSRSGKIVLDLLKKVALEEGGALVMVTHDPQAARSCERLFEIKDGEQC